MKWIASVGMETSIFNSLRSSKRFCQKKCWDRIVWKVDKFSTKNNRGRLCFYGYGVQSRSRLCSIGCTEYTRKPPVPKILRRRGGFVTTHF